MLAISLNIRHGGGGRVQSIADWVLGKAPDVIVLTEWRNNNSGARLRRRLEDRGFVTAHQNRSDPKSNGLLVAAKDAFAVQSKTPTESERGELLCARLKCGVRLLASYFPQNKNKAPFFNRCTIAAAECGSGPLLMIGDINTGLNDLDVEGDGAKFHCADLFAALPASGLVDLWREQHGDRQEWSWRSRINGFRIDHAFGNEAFRARYRPVLCWLDHEPRITGLTDHSAMLVSWSDPDQR